MVRALAVVRSHVRTHRRGVLLWLWAIGLAALVCAPWLRPGYVLTYDMVWVPHLDLTRLEPWGLGSALPRAVPSDAVIALLGAVVPAAVVQRFILAGIFVLGAVGAARLVPGLPLPARLATATFFVWNPLVAERLALGQWPLLVGLAALPWLIVALGEDRPRSGPVIASLAGLALTPVSGLLALVTVLVVGQRFGRYRLIGLVGALNAPWIVAGLLHRTSATSDPAGVTAFAVGSDGPLGRLWSVLSLGGIWNTEVVPVTRELWSTVILVAVGWTIMTVGIVRWRRADRGAADRLAILAGVGLVVACLGWWTPGALQLGVETIPGGGLLRDGGRFLILAVPLLAVALGHGAAAVAERFARPVQAQVVAAVMVLLPIATLPDLALGLAGRVQIAQYPKEWSIMRETISESPVRGDLLVLPFSAYRAPRWNRSRPVLDPAGRYFNRTTIVNDDLRVGEVTIRGEDPRAEEIFDVLESGVIDPVALRQRGVGLVLVDTAAPAAADALRTVGRLSLVADDGALLLFSAGDAVAAQPSTIERSSMIVAWGLAALVLAAAAARTGAARLAHVRRART